MVEEYRSLDYDDKLFKSQLKGEDGLQPVVTSTAVISKVLLLKSFHSQSEQCWKPQSKSISPVV
jgi:hypothetical protein